MKTFSLLLSLSFSLAVEANPIFLQTEDRKGNQVEIIFAAKNLSEARLLDSKTKKLKTWLISTRGLKIEFNTDGEKTHFRIKKYIKSDVKDITGFFAHNKIKIQSNQLYGFKTYYNHSCVDTRLDLKVWADELNSKLGFECSDNNICFGSSCTEIQKQKFGKMFLSNKSKLSKSFSCVLEKPLKQRQALLDITSGNINIACSSIDNSIFKAFYQDTEPQLMNFDPKLFEKEDALIESLIHETIHVEIKDEKKTETLTNEVIRSLNRDDCVKEQKKEDGKGSATLLAADDSLTQSTTAQSATPITPNPAAAQRVTYELEQPISSSTLASLSTPAGQEKYIAATQPARTAALSWANDVVRAVGDTVIPSAHAGTLADSGSTSQKTRKIASVDGADSSASATTSPRAKLDTSSNAVMTTEQKTKKAEPNSSSGTPNEVANRASTKAATSASSPRNIASVNTASSARGSGSSYANTSGNMNNGAGNSLNQKSGSTSTASNSDVVSFIQNTDYHIVKEELSDEGFQARLRREGVKIITLDGKIFGDRNGRVKFTDRGRTFVKEGR